MAMAGAPNVTVLPDLAALSRAGAERFVAAAGDAYRRRERFAVALTGGDTARVMYEVLAAEYAARVPWHVVEAFFGDERCVPPDDPASNYGMAHRALLSHVPLQAERVHRMPGEVRPTDEGARRYERVVRERLAAGGADAGFDLVLLGIGADGHTASLFPGSPALAIEDRWVAAVEAPPAAPVRDRLTLTLPCLTRAREILVVVSGEAKREALQRIWHPGEGEPLPPARLPAARMRWLVDRAAAPGG
ncbi:MAG TPA: 6-phosphogluconolactonase [Gemmatimonadaceae bacterium]|nr:6-phosphogluconolactonase [Gemmatimonadaceae bacterium]